MPAVGSREIAFVLLEQFLRTLARCVDFHGYSLNAVAAMEQRLLYCLVAQSPLRLFALILAENCVFAKLVRMQD